jgi:DNA-binding response OmpR family regulator
MSWADPLTPTVLIVEDDPAIGHHLQVGLQSSGYPTTWCRTGSAGLLHAQKAHPDVVLLDLGLPDLDGVDLARALRGDSPDLLLIILTARSAEIDVIVGLDAGADDYLVKPFSLTVLLARLRAHLRRRPRPVEDEQSVIELGALSIDLAARRCLVDGAEIALRPKEFDLLAALASRRGAAVSRETLMDEVWDENWYGSTKTLDVTMAGLRRRLTTIQQQTATPGSAVPPAIVTLRGYGYRLENPGRTTYERPRG